MFDKQVCSQLMSEPILAPCRENMTEAYLNLTITQPHPNDKVGPKNLALPILIVENLRHVSK